MMHDASRLPRQWESRWSEIFAVRSTTRGYDKTTADLNPAPDRTVGTPLVVTFETFLFSLNPSLYGLRVT